MTVSRDTHDPAKNYRRLTYHQDRTLLDSELNEQQSIALETLKRMADVLFREGAILDGLEVTRTENVLSLSSGLVYINGLVEPVSGSTLEYDEDKSDGADYVYVELLRIAIGSTQDDTLVNPETGEQAAERERWVTTLQSVDTSSNPLPEGSVDRKVVAIYRFDRDTNDVLPTVQQKSNLSLEAFAGTLPGQRITVGSVGENQLALRAAEGMVSILDNLAERTFDQAGNYLVEGLDSVLGEDNNLGAVGVTTNAGRAYVRGYRYLQELPVITSVPKALDNSLVSGEQKTFHTGTRVYRLNSQPLMSTSQVEAIVSTTSAITRGSTAGGEDVLPHTPVASISAVTQGQKTFVKNVDWQQNGNSVDWLGQDEPIAGTTYTVAYTYTKQLVKDTDYADGSWFGKTNFPAEDEYFYAVTAISEAGESEYMSGRVVSRSTFEGEINRLSWPAVPGAIGYKVYRGTASGRTDLLLLKTVGLNAYEDDGVDATTSANPPAVNTSGVSMTIVSIEAGNNSCINFGRDNAGTKPVNGSNVSIDYGYYLGRRDIIAVANGSIVRISGVSSTNPKDPVVPATALGLCSVYCPPNSAALQVHNFGLRRITMDRIYRLIEQVEEIKYNEARSQMNATLLNRTSDAKKGVYSDDFTNPIQSDVNHPDWNARLDTMQAFVAPPRAATGYLLAVNEQTSTARRTLDIATLPATERVIAEQLDWSEELNVNPHGSFDVPPASIQVSPTMGRAGVTTIGVTGDNFSRSTTTISVRLDGVVMVQNISTDWWGRFSCTFGVPNNALLGMRTVSVTDGSRSASAPLEVQAPAEVTRATPTVDTTRRREINIYPQRITVSRIDPLAQTFSFTESKTISAVGLYFTTKSTTVPMVVQVRGVTMGMPNNVIYAEKQVVPTDITLNAETKVTFDNPILCEANVSYALVLLSDSQDYRVRVAMVGAIGQHGTITRQAYGAGVLLTSANAETWSARQNADMSMRIYGLTFQGTGVLTFNPVGTIDITELHLDEYSTIPQGCSILWEYSRNTGVTWTAFTPGEDEIANPAGSGPMLVRATLSSPRGNESPAIAFKNLMLIGYLGGLEGAYISRQIETTQSIGAVTAYIEANMPSGTTFTPYVSVDGGSTWTELVVDTTRSVDQTWTEYTLQAEPETPGTLIRFKVEFTGSTPGVFARVHKLGATLA